MRFNKNNKGRNKTTNFEGATAYNLTPELELYSTVATASLQRKFYEKEDETIKRIRNLISKVSPKFVAQLAIYCREKMYLRSVPLVLAVELSKIHRGDKLVSKLVEQIIQRPDELTEILAYYIEANERKGTKKLNKLAKQIQKGLAKAFNKFDEYQFAKYNKKSEITLKDTLFLSHAKAKTKEQEQLFKKLVDGKLAIPYTWETELSKGEDKKGTWEKLIDSQKIGYMALLRNLRNILNADVSAKHIEKVGKYLSNKKAVENSKQLPFRFLSAYNEILETENTLTPEILTYLEEAILYTAENIQGFDINTSVCVACDVSGSMFATISPKSKVKYYDIGLMLGMLLQNRCKNVITGIFGNIWKTKQLPKTSILRNVNDLQRIEGEVGYSTNGYKVLEGLLTNKQKVDKIMMFTDCQLWNSHYHGDAMLESWNKYKKFHLTAKLYLFDMAGYGNTPLKVDNKDVYMIAGWSDKIFDVLSVLEEGKTAINEIKAVKM